MTVENTLYSVYPEILVKNLVVEKLHFVQSDIF